MAKTSKPPTKVVKRTGTKAAIPVAAKKQEYEKVEMPSIEDAGLDGEFVALGDEIAILMAKRKALDEKITERRLVALALAEEVKSDEGWSARGEGWSFSYVKPKPRETLMKELLIQHGVSMQVINRSIKRVEQAPFVIFRADGEKE